MNAITITEELDRDLTLVHNLGKLLDYPHHRTATYCLRTEAGGVGGTAVGDGGTGVIVATSAVGLIRVGSFVTDVAVGRAAVLVAAGVSAWPAADGALVNVSTWPLFWGSAGVMVATPPINRAIAAAT